MSPPAPRRNIELKARCRDLQAAAAAARALSPPPRDAGVMRQVDTFFVVSHGRLKLREIEPADGPPRAELITYHRADHPVARASDYRLVDVPDPAALKAALADTCGVRGVVGKRRHVLLWHDVRIHLDEVDGLGSFVEFEAVVTSSDQEPLAHERLAALMNALDLRPTDVERTAYIDLSGPEVRTG